MPNKDTIAGFEHVAQTTIDLLEFKQTPDVLSDAILETLIEMSAESRANLAQGNGHQRSDVSRAVQYVCGRCWFSPHETLR